MADLTTRDLLELLARQPQPREPVVAPWLTQQLEEARAAEGPLHGARFPSGLFDPLTGAAGLAAELSGVPSIARGVGHLQEEGGDAWKKAQGVGEIAMGAMPGLAVTRAGAPLVNMLMGSAPRAVGTMGAAMVPGGVVSAQDSQKAADAALSQIAPPEYMTKELGELQKQKAAKQQEFNALNQKHAKSGPETQRQALDPLRNDLATLNTKVTEAEGRIRDHLAKETERQRKELPFRQRYPGAAETIGGTAAALSAFLPFASTVKNRLGDALEGVMMGRAANKADKAFNADKLPEFVEAQSALARRAQSLDDKTSGAVYPIMGVQGPKLATQVGLGTLVNFEGGSIPEQVDALAFPPGHKTRERARDELSNPDYYKSRALPAFLWGLGMTGLGTEAGHLMTPGARVPERVRSVVDRGSPESIEQLNKIAQYRQAVEAAKGAGQKAGAAQRLEAAASESAPLARPGTSGSQELSARPEIAEGGRLVDRLLAPPQGQQLPAGPSSSQQLIETLRRGPANSNKPKTIRVKESDGIVKHRDPETQQYTKSPDNDK
jgi:hypothetical protein